MWNVSSDPRGIAALQAGHFTPGTTAPGKFFRGFLISFFDSICTNYALLPFSDFLARLQFSIPSAISSPFSIVISHQRFPCPAAFSIF
jgi:hypothetical protein